MRERIEDDITRYGEPASEAAQTLAGIALPRRSGTAAYAYAAAHLRERMAALGYECQTIPFTFSAFVGSFGVAIAAGLFGTGAVGAAVLLLFGVPIAAAASLVAGLVLTLAIALSWTRMLHSLPLGRRTRENMLFRRSGAQPRYIVMAHLDTKSQLLPLALRGPAILLAAAGWIALAVAVVVALTGASTGALAPIAAAVTGVASLALALSWAGNRSPGALDNASGVAAAVGVAAACVDAGDVAVLITDAEEMGLAGARAAASQLPTVHGVINLDGLDDVGTFYILERFGLPRRGLAPHLAVALLESAERKQWPANRRDVPFGVLLDHMPIVDAGVTAVTVMRGEWRSLARVHRPTDDLAHLTGEGVVATVELVAGAVDRLRDNDPASESL